jgi:hypothetical protein
MNEITEHERLIMEAWIGRIEDACETLEPDQLMRSIAPVGLWVERAKVMRKLLARVRTA